MYKRFVQRRSAVGNCRWPRVRRSIRCGSVEHQLHIQTQVMHVTSLAECFVIALYT